MAYEKTEWIARQGANLNRFEKEQETVKSVVLQNVPSTVTVKGTKFSPANMNKIEQGIYDAHEMIDSEAQTREQAVLGINTILNDLIALPAWNSNNHILTFTARDGSTLTVDLPLEGLAKNIDYDPAEKEIIITKQDNSQIRVSVADLVDVYTGSLGTHIQVTIGANNTIQADLRAGTITETELAATLLNTLVRTSGDQTVAGVKTFTSVPVLPSSDPASANQATRKAYVDAAYNTLLSMINALASEDVGELFDLLNQKAQKNHASTTTDYGIANGSTYGHVRFPTAATTSNIPKSALPYEYIGVAGAVNLNDYRVAGKYVFYSPSSISNFPVEWGTGSNNAAILEVLPFYSDSVVRQTLHKRGTNQIWVRYSTSASAWGAWERIITATHSFFRVGMIYMSVDNVNPATFIGGTWTVWGSGRVPVGVDTAQTEFNTVEKTNPSTTKTHTLSKNELASHNHTQSSHTHTTHTGRIHLLAYQQQSVNADGVFSVGGDVFGGDNNGISGYSNMAINRRSIQLSATHNSVTPAIQNEGGGAEHNNLQPYITCYMWKRTA